MLTFYLDLALALMIGVMLYINKRMIDRALTVKKVTREVKLGPDENFKDAA
jgi:TnpA family transposase